MAEMGTCSVWIKCSHLICIDIGKIFGLSYHPGVYSLPDFVWLTVDSLLMLWKNIKAQPFSKFALVGICKSVTLTCLFIVVYEGVVNIGI